MTSVNDKVPPEAPVLRSSRSFMSQVGVMPESNTHTAEATTAVTLESAEQAELSFVEPDSKSPLLKPTHSNNPSFLGSFSPNVRSVDSSDSEDGSEASHGGLHLSGILNSLMTPEHGKPNLGAEGIQVHNPLTEDATAFDEEFLRSKVIVDKSDFMFKEKLKHFFVLSAAGKPIYSLHGTDDVLMGYMGLITTIVASFQEGMKKDVKSISSGSLKIVAKNKYPLYLVAITKLPHEINSIGPDGTTTLEIQLECLYNYILAVLSKSVIIKNFDSGMNYDLRRILTAQDTTALDALAMKLTYGFHQTNETDVSIDTPFYLGSVLDNAMRCVRVSNTSRKRLNDILVSVKKLKGSSETTGFVSTISNGFISSSEGALVFADLLFGFITLNDKVLSYLHPQSHQLGRRDIATLLFVIQMNSASSKDRNTDLWVPLCMPQFNSTGFLYCYVKEFTIPECASPLTIVLVSGSKNSFYNMKDAANSVVSNIHKSEFLSKRLGPEITHYNGQSSVLRELKISSIKHFIYKRKKIDQVFVDEHATETALSDTSAIQSSLQMMFLYSNLINAKGSDKQTKSARSKRLTYTRSQLNGTFVSGFLLVDDDCEFFCICEGSVTSKTIINESIRIMKWCDRYKKRLFVKGGVTF